MSVFEFEKSLLIRLEESTDVLQCKNEPVLASQVRAEWAYHVELQIEPAGWQALWNISRALCEELSIKYPTVVAGTVTNVHFKDLKAEFMVSAVQDDDVSIPEFHVVPLEDLWVAKDQENVELNSDRTADCIDQLRFFYRNIWMPWDEDNDEDVDWCEKHLQSRIRFCFDLKRGMSRPMADHIRMLLTEARYIQSRRELLETALVESDFEDMDESNAMDRTHATNLMRLHLRLAVIKNEIELLENPEMRIMYEEIHFSTKSNNGNEHGETTNYIVSRDGTISQHISYLEAAKAFIPEDKSIKIIPILQDCLKISAPSDQIYIPIGQHNIKSVRILNANGSIRAILDEKIGSAATEREPNSAVDAVITSAEEDSILFAFNGDYTLENLTLDCRNVRTGLWIRDGNITLKNCMLLGDGRSSTGNGINVSNGARLNLINCLIRKFAVGVCCEPSANITVVNTKVLNCKVGWELTDQTAIDIKSSVVGHCNSYGVLFKSRQAIKKPCLNFEDLKKLVADNKINSNITGDFEFQHNHKGGILIVRDDRNESLQNSEYIEDSLNVDNKSVACPLKADGDKKLKEAGAANNNKLSTIHLINGSGGSVHNKASTSDGEDHEMSMNDSVIILD